MKNLSIIIPVLDEAARITAALSTLAPLRQSGAEIIVVDGGSRDETAALAATAADRVLLAGRGRARQMNAGATVARGELLLFLHADTGLPADAAAALAAASDSGFLWGHFDVAIEGRSPLLPFIAAAMNLRSRLSGIATGDQAIFVRRDAFTTVGGFPEIPLMEDIAISRRLRRLAPPACLRQRVATSGRRWDAAGAVRTIGLMWWLRLRYFLGTDPTVLARAYGYHADDDAHS